MRICDWSSDVCSSDLFIAENINPDQPVIKPDDVIIYNRTEPEDIKLSRTGRFRYGNGSLRYGSLRWMLFACSVVIQTAFLAFTFLLTLLGLNYSHEHLTGSKIGRAPV